MDRFIASKTGVEYVGNGTLKSNMDRFIDILGFTNEQQTKL